MKVWASPSWKKNSEKKIAGKFFSEPKFFCSWLFFFEQKIFFEKINFHEKIQKFSEKIAKKSKNFTPKKWIFLEEKIHYFGSKFLDFFVIFSGFFFWFFREKIFSQKIFFARKKKSWTKKIGSEKNFPTIFFWFFFPTRARSYLHFPLL